MSKVQVRFFLPKSIPRLKRMLRQLHSFGGSIPSTPSTSMSTMDLETGNGVVEVDILGVVPGSWRFLLRNMVWKKTTSGY